MWSPKGRLQSLLLLSILATSAMAQSQTVSSLDGLQLPAPRYSLSSHLVSLPKGTMEKPGHVSFAINDDPLGQSAAFSYQPSSWLQLGLQYDKPITAADTYQYNFALSPIQLTRYPVAVNVGMRDVFDTADKQSGFVATTWLQDHYDVTAGVMVDEHDTRFYAGTAWRIPALKSQINLQYIQHHEHISQHASESFSTVSRDRDNGWRLSWEWYAHPNLMFSVSHDNDQSLGLGVQWRANAARPASTGRIKQTVFERQYHINDTDTSINTSTEDMSLTRGLDSKALASLGWRLMGTTRDHDRLLMVLAAIDDTHSMYNVVPLHTWLSQTVDTPISEITYVVVRDSIPIYKHTLPVITAAQNTQYLDSVWQFEQIQPVTTHDLSRISALAVTTPLALDTQLINRIWLPKPLDASDASTTDALSSNLSMRFTGTWQWHPRWEFEAQYEANLHRNMTQPIGSRPPADSSVLIPHRYARYVELYSDHQRLERAALNAFYPFNTGYVNHTYAQAFKASIGQLSSTIRGVSFAHSLHPWQSPWSFGASAVWAEPTSALARWMQNPEQNMHSWLVHTKWHSRHLGLRMTTQMGRFLGGDKGAKFTINQHLKQGWRVGLWYTVSFAQGQRFVDKGIQLSIPLGTFTPSSSKVSMYSHIREVSGNSGVTLHEHDPMHAWGEQIFSKGG